VYDLSDDVDHCVTCMNWVTKCLCPPDEVVICSCPCFFEPEDEDR